MVYNLCLLGALRDKPNNFGLTQRLNQKTLVTFMTVILPCSLAWSFTALSTAFSMLYRAAHLGLSLSPHCGCLTFQTPHSSPVQVPFHTARGMLQTSVGRLNPQLCDAEHLQYFWGVEEVSAWTQWPEIWIIFSRKFQRFFLYLIGIKFWWFL